MTLCYIKLLNAAPVILCANAAVKCWLKFAMIDRSLAAGSQVMASHMCH